MSSRRPARRLPRSLVTALAVGALALGAAAQTSADASVPVSSAAEAGPDVAAVLLASAKPPLGRAWIQGTVTDQAGRFHDNVVVEAFAPGSPTAVATSLTYASPNDGVAHGFYRLRVPGSSTASYTVRFSSAPGAADPFRTTTYAAPVRARGAAVVALPNTVLELVRTASTSLKATAKAKSGRSGRLKVAVSSPDVSAVQGTLKVTLGRKKVGTATVTAASSGRVSLKLPKLRPGTYKIKVAFTPTSHVASATRTVKLKVGGKAKHRPTG